MFARTSLRYLPFIFGLLLAPAVANLPAQKARTTQASAGRSFLTSGHIAIPFEYFKHHIYISVQVNGLAGLSFMVDSGADQNVLGLRAARKLGLQTGRLRQEQKVGFGDGLIYTAPRARLDARVDSIQVARSMAVIDLTRFERHFSHTTDGMLGGPFFERFVVKFDFSNHIMTLFPAVEYSYRGLGIRTRLSGTRKNFILLPVAVGSPRGLRHPIQAIVDTGSNATLMLYESFAHALQLDGSLAHAQPAKAYGLDGYYSIKRGTVPWLAIGSAETRDLPVDYIPSGGVHPIKRSAGAIGTGILQGFQNVIFDVPHRQMIFEVKRPPLAPGVVRTETAGP
jgi:hypothetical protein